MNKVCLEIEISKELVKRANNGEIGIIFLSGDKKGKVIEDILYKNEFLEEMLKLDDIERIFVKEGGIKIVDNKIIEVRNFK